MTSYGSAAVSEYRADSADAFNTQAQDMSGDIVFWVSDRRLIGSTQYMQVVMLPSGSKAEEFEAAATKADPAQVRVISYGVTQTILPLFEGCFYAGQFDSKTGFVSGATKTDIGSVDMPKVSSAQLMAVCRAASPRSEPAVAAPMAPRQSAPRLRCLGGA